MIFRPSLTDTAYNYWATQFHKQSRRAQKPHSIFSVTEFIHIDANNSAKGLSKDMEQFFCPPHPQVLSTTYYNVLTRMIKPEEFVDMRNWAEEDYMQWGDPGKEPEFFLPNYTTWYNALAEAKRVRQLRIETKVFTALVQIGQYWHIGPASNYRPRTNKEIASGTMEAIGIGYLRHPLLPKPNQTPPGSIEND